MQRTVGYLLCKVLSSKHEFTNLHSRAEGPKNTRRHTHSRAPLTVQLWHRVRIAHLFAPSHRCQSRCDQSFLAIVSAHCQTATNIGNAASKQGERKDLRLSKIGLRNERFRSSLESTLRLLGNAPESRSDGTACLLHIDRAGCEDARERRSGHCRA